MINLNSTNTPIGKTQFFSQSQKNEFFDDLKNSIDNNDTIIITKLNNLKNSLEGPTINLNYIKQQIEDLSSFKKAQNYEYLNSLLCPEKSRGCKMPSQIPVPSCSFQLHNSITLTTNSTGYLAFLMNPCFLASETVIDSPVVVNGAVYNIKNFLTSAWLNNDNTLQGTAANNNFVPINFFQTLPDVYDQYRLVSASLVIRYIGRLDEVKGQIGGAIFYDQVSTLGGMVLKAEEEEEAVNTGCPYISKYGVFDYALDAFYSQTNNTLEGIRMLYFPLDNSYEEYTKIMSPSVLAVEDKLIDTKVVLNPDPTSYKGTFNWFFWASGCPEGKACFKADIYCNFECLPNAKFLNYMPISINNIFIPHDKRKEWITQIQHHPIMKANEDISNEVTIPDIFIRMIKKFKNGLPGFERLRAMGLIGAIPSLKPGLALAGNMIATQMDYE